MPLLDQLHRAVTSSLGANAVDLPSWVRMCRKAGIIGKELSMSKVSVIFMEVLEAGATRPEPHMVRF